MGDNQKFDNMFSYEKDFQKRLENNGDGFLFKKNKNFNFKNLNSSSKNDNLLNNTTEIFNNKTPKKEINDDKSKERVYHVRKSEMG